MDIGFNKSQLALAVVAAVSTGAGLPTIAYAKTPGQYVAGDFHNHTTCSDGAISMQKLVKKSMDKTDGTYGLDWFVQAGHGGRGNRNCTLVEDATLATPAYPEVFAADGVTPLGPITTWQNSNPAIQPKGAVNGTAPNQNMWRWQSIQEFQYPLIEYLNAQKDLPLFIGLETVAPGHEHVSMGVITGQIPGELDTATLPTTPGYTALGNADALSQWEYCFDRNDTDTSRGNTTTTSGIGNNWDCSVPGSANAADPNWNAAAMKLVPATGAGVGNRGHAKAVESLKWMAAFHPDKSYYVPAHLERAGPFNPNGNNGFNIENLRNFNNAAPNVAFGFESQPGHHASDARGEYQIKRQTINGVVTDSVGGTTYGGTGVYAAQIGGVWDALLGEGRNWWFFGSSDWHNRGSFGPDDRRSTQDFYPGEYQRNYSLVRNGDDKIRPQAIVDSLRTGNTWVATGQIVDRLGFIACASYKGPAARSNASVEALAIAAATNNTDIDKSGCATMGEKLVVRPGAEIVVSVVVRDPAGTNYSPYTFPNPSLAQIGVGQPLNAPVLDHIDLIRGMVTGYKTPGSADYAGQWPINTAWLDSAGNVAGLSSVPAAAKNTSTAIIKTFNQNGASAWSPVVSNLDNTQYLKMTYRVPAVSASQYLRLRGTNLPAGVPYETDANGNPLPDVFTNAVDKTMLRIPCATAHSANSQFDGCPDHMDIAISGTPLNGNQVVVNPIAGQKAVSYDVAAWADLWVYSNPIYIQVTGSTVVAGVN